VTVVFIRNDLYELLIIKLIYLKVGAVAPDCVRSEQTVLPFHPICPLFGYFGPDTTSAAYAFGSD